VRSFELSAFNFQPITLPFVILSEAKGSLIVGAANNRNRFFVAPLLRMTKKRTTLPEMARRPSRAFTLRSVILSEAKDLLSSGETF